MPALPCRELLPAHRSLGWDQGSSSQRLAEAVNVVLLCTPSFGGAARMPALAWPPAAPFLAAVSILGLLRSWPRLPLSKCGRAPASQAGGWSLGPRGENKPSDRPREGRSAHTTTTPRVFTCEVLQATQGHVPEPRPDVGAARAGEAPHRRGRLKEQVAGLPPADLSREAQNLPRVGQTWVREKH